MANSPNFNWELPDDTDLVKDGASAMRTLGNAIDSSLVDLKGGTTGQVLSKASNTDLDFTWSSVDPLTILDAKGDLITATAADTPARLASSGNNGDLLTVDTSTATGLKWAAPAASGGMTLISETVASGLSSLSLSSIPSTYKQLVLIWTGIYHSGNDNQWEIRLNNSSSLIYGDIWTSLINNSPSTSASTKTECGEQPFGNNIISTDIHQVNRGYFLVDNYASTTKVKTYQMDYSWRNRYGDRLKYIVQGLYNSTSAITSIDIVRSAGTGTFSNISNTSIRLYGVS